MDPKDVTIAIPCYNNEDTLPEVLRAIDRLNPSPATVLCLCDKSADTTEQIIKDHKGSRLISLAKNKGIAAARNAALSETTTPGLAMIDADIVIPSDWLKQMCDEMDRSEASYVQGRFTDRVTTLGDQWRKRHVTPNFPEHPLLNYPINGANILTDANALRDIGGWNEQLSRSGEDLDVAERLIEAGYKVYYTPTVQAVHIRTDTWKQTVRTSWSYYNYHYGRRPIYVGDILKRIPDHVSLSCLRMYLDIRDLQFQILWITIIQIFYYVMWDINNVKSSLQ